MTQQGSATNINFSQLQDLPPDQFKEAIMGLLQQSGQQGGQQQPSMGQGGQQMDPSSLGLVQAMMSGNMQMMTSRARVGMDRVADTLGMNPQALRNLDPKDISANTNAMGSLMKLEAAQDNVGGGAGIQYNQQNLGQIYDKLPQSVRDRTTKDQFTSMAPQDARHLVQKEVLTEAGYSPEQIQTQLGQTDAKVAAAHDNMEARYDKSHGWWDRNISGISHDNKDYLQNRSNLVTRDDLNLPSTSEMKPFDSLANGQQPDSKTPTKDPQKTPAPDTRPKYFNFADPPGPGRKPTTHHHPQGHHQNHQPGHQHQPTPTEQLHTLQGRIGADEARLSSDEAAIKKLDAELSQGQGHAPEQSRRRAFPGRNANLPQGSGAQIHQNNNVVMA